MKFIFFVLFFAFVVSHTKVEKLHHHFELEKKIDGLNEIIRKESNRRSVQQMKEILEERQNSLKELIKISPEKSTKFFFTNSEIEEMNLKGNAVVEKFIECVDCEFTVVAAFSSSGDHCRYMRGLKTPSNDFYESFVYGKGEGVITIPSGTFYGHVLDNYFVLDNHKIDQHLRRSTEWVNAATTLNTGLGKTLTTIRMEYPDLTGTASIAEVDSVNSVMEWYFKEASYNIFGFSDTGFVTCGIYQMSSSSSTYQITTTAEFTAFRNEAHSIANSNGCNPTATDFDVTTLPLISSSSRFGFAGIAYIGQPGIIVNGDHTWRVLGHELGHNLVLRHAKLLHSQEDPKRTGFGGTYEVIEYGDYFDLMGLYNYNYNHFNVIHKETLEWISSSSLQVIDNSVADHDSISKKYPVYECDNPNVTPSLTEPVGIKVPYDSSTQNDDIYYFSYKSKPAETTEQLIGGIYIHVKTSDHTGTVFVDTNPDPNLSTPNVADVWDAPIILGRTWYDENSTPKIGVTPTAKLCSNEFSTDNKKCFLSTFVFFGEKKVDNLPTLQLEGLYYDFSEASTYFAPSTNVEIKLIEIFGTKAKNLEGSYYWECDDNGNTKISVSKSVLNIELGTSVNTVNCFIEHTDLKSNTIQTEAFTIKMNSGFNGNIQFEGTVDATNSSISLQTNLNFAPYIYRLTRNSKEIFSSINHGSAALTNDKIDLLSGLNSFKMTVQDSSSGTKIIKDSELVEYYSNNLCNSINDFSNSTNDIYSFILPPLNLIVYEQIDFIDSQISKLDLIDYSLLSNTEIEVSNYGDIFIYFPFTFTESSIIQFEFKTSHPEFSNFISFESSFGTNNEFQGTQFLLNGDVSSDSLFSGNSDYSLGTSVINQYRTIEIPIGNLLFSSFTNPNIFYLKIRKGHSFYSFSENGNIEWLGKSFFKNFRIYDSKINILGKSQTEVTENDIFDYSDYSTLSFEWKSDFPNLIVDGENSPTVTLNPLLNFNLQNISLTVTETSSNTIVLKDILIVESTLVKTCFSKLSNDSTVCSSHGDCILDDVCKCNDDYDGPNCQFPKCYGYSANSTDVCSGGHGICPDVNTCQCSSDYGGTQCEFPKCFSILANETTLVCSEGHGSCTDVDTCVCNSGYEGDNCENWNCFGIMNNESAVCSGGHGVCSDIDICECDEFHTGSNCQFDKCFDISANNSEVCSSHGSCIAYNTCECDENYYGDHCNITTCSGIFSNLTDVCNSEGSCIEYNTCECFNNGRDYGGTNCELYKCYGFIFNESEVCSNQGNCSSLHNCDCYGDWLGNVCNITQCFGIFTNETSSVVPICSGHGLCVDKDNCTCSTGYYGNQCQYHDCFGNRMDANSTCSGNGICSSPDTCVCDSSWYGNTYSGEECAIKTPFATIYFFVEEYWMFIAIACGAVLVLFVLICIAICIISVIIQKRKKRKEELAMYDSFNITKKKKNRGRRRRRRQNNPTSRRNRGRRRRRSDVHPEIEIDEYGFDV